MRVRAGWAVVLLLVAALGFAASFRGSTPVVAVVLATLLPFAAVALGRLLGAGTTTPALLVVVLAAGGAWLAARSGDAGLGDALPRLLTTPRPASAEALLLAPPVLLVAVVAAVVAARTLAGPDLVTPVVGAVVLYGAAQLLAAGAADAHGVVAVCLLVLAATGWTHPALHHGSRSRWAPVVVVPLVLAGVLGLGAAALTAGTAYDPRQDVTAPTTRLTGASPWAQLRTWTANPSATVLRARVAGTDRLRLATLATFTGADWRVDGRFRTLGLVGGGDLAAADRTRTVRATVRLDRLGGLWLPTPAAVTTAGSVDALLDPDGGTLAAPGRVRPGLTYTVEGRVDAPSDRDVAIAPAPTDPPSRYLALPGVPAGFAQYARAAVRGSSTPFEEAVALENAVSTGRRVDPTAPTGSSSARLSTFLFARTGAGAGVGTAEQFATAFAVLAREVGLPSRVVIGLVLPSGAGTVTVHGRDATAWPEVWFAGAGWVPFAPTPGGADGAAGGALRQEVLQRLSEKVRSLPPLPPPAATAPVPAPTPSVAASPRSSVGAEGSGGALVVLVVAGSLVAVLLVTVGLRQRRTRRHRRAGARGAWAELVDLLVLVGRRPAAHRPAPEVAADAADVLGEQGAVVAAAADREAFAPGGPPAPPVWGHVRVVRRRAAAALPRHRRLLLPVDPRPLLRRRRVSR